MNRRKFINGVAVGATGTALPLWLAGFFQRKTTTLPASCDLPPTPPTIERIPPIQVQCVSDPAPTTLKEAFLRAQKLGKPLLVFGIPGDDLKWEWGRIYGAFLNYAPDSDLALLSLCELYCTPVDELQSFAHTKTTAMMVLLETNQSEPVANELIFDREQIVTENTDEDKRDDAFVETLGNALYKVLVGHEKADGRLFENPTLEKRKAQLLQANPEAEELAMKHSSGMAPIETAGSAAAFLYPATEYDSGRRETLLLVQEVRLRLCLQPPTGAHWANASSCGSTIEGKERHMIDGCGMGHTPKKSQRFLSFFTQR
jgi:hypothetical protein